MRCTHRYSVLAFIIVLIYLVRIFQAPARVAQVAALAHLRQKRPPSAATRRPAPALRVRRSWSSWAGFWHTDNLYRSLVLAGMSALNHRVCSYQAPAPVAQAAVPAHLRREWPPSAASRRPAPALPVRRLQAWSRGSRAGFRLR